MVPCLTTWGTVTYVTVRAHISAPGGIAPTTVDGTATLTGCTFTDPLYTLYGVDGTWSATTGYLTWTLPDGCYATFTISALGITATTGTYHIVDDADHIIYLNDLIPASSAPAPTWASLMWACTQQPECDIVTDYDVDCVDGRFSGNVAITGTASASNLSGTNTGDQDLSGRVPYTGATANVDLGAYQLRCSTFKMTTGASAGYVLTSDADGDGAWTALPSEADTLQTVTDRGATTTNGITIGDTGTCTIDEYGGISLVLPYSYYASGANSGFDLSPAEATYDSSPAIMTRTSLSVNSAGDTSSRWNCTKSYGSVWRVRDLAIGALPYWLTLSKSDGTVSAVKYGIASSFDANGTPTIGATMALDHGAIAFDEPITVKGASPLYAEVDPRLPAVGSAGDVLTVVGGVWASATPAGGSDTLDNVCDRGSTTDQSPQAPYWISTSQFNADNPRPYGVPETTDTLSLDDEFNTIQTAGADLTGWTTHTVTAGGTWAKSGGYAIYDPDADGSSCYISKDASALTGTEFTVYLAPSAPSYEAEMGIFVGASGADDGDGAGFVYYYGGGSSAGCRNVSFADWGAPTNGTAYLYLRPKYIAFRYFLDTTWKISTAVSEDGKNWTTYGYAITTGVPQTVGTVGIWVKDMGQVKQITSTPSLKLNWVRVK